MRIKQDLHTCNAPIYLRTECSKDMRPEQEKNLRDQLWFIIGALNLIRIAHLRRRHVLIFITHEYIDAPKFCAYHLLIK